MEPTLRSVFSILLEKNQLWQKSRSDISAVGLFVGIASLVRLVDGLVGLFDYFLYATDFAVADRDLQAVRFCDIGFVPRA